MKLKNNKDSHKAGIYIHIPFCRKKCGYCDFYSITNLNIVDKFSNSIKKEIKIYNQLYNTFLFDTIYFGGGTPSLLEIKVIEKILNCLYKNFKIDTNTEITFEVNPEDIIEKKDLINNLKKLGINRISFGMQSLQKRHLNFLNRFNNIEKIKFALEKVLKYIINVNVDIIHSIPGMNLKDISNTLKYLIKLNIPHISSYSLIYEEETPLFLKIEQKKVKPLDSDEEYEQYNFIKEILESNNYIHYEISNFAKKGYESKHNLKYWNFQNYLGLGPSSHSMMNLVRWNNYRNIIKYNILLNNNRLPIENEYKLSKSHIETELIYLGLRSSGVDVQKIKYYTGINFKEKYRKSIELLTKNGFAKLFKNKFKLTKEGFFLADEIMVRYF